MHNPISLSGGLRSTFPAAGVTALLALLAGCTPPPEPTPTPDPEVSTLRFNLTSAPLAPFGIEFHVDESTPAEGVQGRRIVSTRVHLEFNTEHAEGSLPDAATIAVQMQPPTVNVPVGTFAGADFGWSGMGSFTGDVETDFFNEPILDYSDMPGALALWFVRIVNLNDDAPELGGAFSNSYIEVDLAPVTAE